jgi:hypothetical protein
MVGAPLVALALALALSAAADSSPRPHWGGDAEAKRVGDHAGDAPYRAGDGAGAGAGAEACC